MTTCKMCPNPVLGRRRVYCSAACQRAGHDLIMRERYRNDPLYAEQIRARARAWNAACRARGETPWQRRKALRFARMLGKAG